MSTVTVRFERVSSARFGVKTFCKKCHKKLTRTVREEQTMNPWNTTEVEGVKRTRTRKEIFDDCEAKVLTRIAELKTQGTIYIDCEE